jgi:hypothetical protein
MSDPPVDGYASVPNISATVDLPANDDAISGWRRRARRPTPSQGVEEMPAWSKMQAAKRAAADLRLRAARSRVSGKASSKYELSGEEVSAKAKLKAVLAARRLTSRVVVPATQKIEVKPEFIAKEDPSDAAQDPTLTPMLSFVAKRQKQTKIATGEPGSLAATDRWSKVEVAINAARKLTLKKRRAPEFWKNPAVMKQPSVNQNWRLSTRQLPSSHGTNYVIEQRSDGNKKELLSLASLVSLDAMVDEYEVAEEDHSQPKVQAVAHMNIATGTGDVEAGGVHGRRGGSCDRRLSKQEVEPEVDDEADSGSAANFNSQPAHFSGLSRLWANQNAQGKGKGGHAGKVGGSANGVADDGDEGEDWVVQIEAIEKELDASVHQWGCQVGKARGGGGGVGAGHVSKARRRKHGHAQEVYPEEELENISEDGDIHDISSDGESAAGGESSGRNESRAGGEWVGGVWHPAEAGLGSANSSANSDFTHRAGKKLRRRSQVKHGKKGAAGGGFAGFASMDAEAEEKAQAIEAARAWTEAPQTAAVQAKVLDLGKHLKALRDQHIVLQRKYDERSGRVAHLETALEDEKKANEEAREEWESQWDAQQAREEMGGGLMIGINAGTGSAAEREAARQRRRDEMRRRALDAADDDDDDDDGFLDGADDVLGVVAVCIARIKAWAKKMNHKYFLARDIRSVDSRFGSSVAIYFRFLRWVLLTYTLVGLICFVSFVTHLGAVWDRADTDEPWNIVQLSSDGIASSNDGSGVLGTLKYSMVGNSPLPWLLQISSFLPSEAFHYSALLVGCNSLVIVLTLAKWVGEDRHAKRMSVVSAVSSQAKYGRLALASWDHSLARSSEVFDQKCAVEGAIAVTLQEDHVRSKRSERSRAQRCALYCRRFVGISLYFGLQCSCWAAILYLMGQSERLESLLEDTYPFLGAVSASLVPASVSVINAVLPPLIGAIVKLEKYDDAGTIAKQMTIRLYFAKIFNAGIQVFSYLLLVDPVLYTRTTSVIDLDLGIGSVFGDSTPALNGENRQSTISISEIYVRKAAAKEFNGFQYRCRSEQAAAGLFNLVVTEFLVGKILGVTIPYITEFVANARGKPSKKSEFRVDQMMVNLLYFQALVFMAFPFAPYTSIVCGLLIFTNFKCDAWITFRFRKKPHRSWSARDAGSFFIKFYFITLIMSVVACHYILASTHLPKSCALQDRSVQLCEGTGSATTDGGSAALGYRCERLRNGSATLGASTYFVPSAPSYSAHAAPSHCTAGYPACICAPQLNSTETALAYHQSTSAPTAAPTSTTNHTAVAVKEASNAQSSDNVGGCGPFRFHPRGYQPLLDEIDGVALMGKLFDIATTSVIFVWGVALVAVLAASFRRNSLGVIRDMHSEKEQLWREMADVSARKLRKAQKRITLLERK